MAGKEDKSRQRGKNQWVVRVGDQWGVRGEGNRKLTRITDTQKEALDLAIQIAQKHDSEVIVQNREGRIRLKEQHENIKNLLEKWDAEPDQESNEWWDELETLLRENHQPEP
jgi:hypothetical protein